MMNPGTKDGQAARRKAGRVIREARLRKRMSQRELAEAVGVCAMAVSNWENGEKSPRPMHTRKICEALGIDEAAITANDCLIRRRPERALRLKRMRLNAGISQTIAAARIRTGVATLSAWEKGTERPTPREAAEMAAAYGVDLIEILEALNDE